MSPEQKAIDNKQQHKINEYLKPQLVKAIEKAEAPVQGTDVSSAEDFEPVRDPNETYAQEQVSAGHQESCQEEFGATNVFIDEMEEH